MSQKIPIFIKIEITIMIISVISFIISTIPFYSDSFKIDYKSSIGTILTFLSAIGFLGIIIFIINTLLLKFKFWFIRFFLVLIFFIALTQQY